MVRATPATAGDVDPAVACATAAFAADPMMFFFFGGSPMGVQAATARFFSLLMRARLALRMPALVARQDDAIVGMAMGYDTTSPQWPDELDREWAAFEGEIPGVAERFTTYEKIAERYRPEMPHYYLGVIAVDPRLQGRGLGRALIEDFCALSEADPRSDGVYLETGSTESLAFYLRNGFVLRGEEPLGSGRLWCVFRPT